jgi:competence protein ComEA
LRGEAGRVAARVREVLGTADLGADSERDGVPELHRSGPNMLRRLAALVPVRIDPGRRAAWAVGAAVLVAALLTGLWVINSRPRPLEVGAGASLPTRARMAALPGTVPLDTSGAPMVGSAAAPSAMPSARASEVVVDVAGKVRRPGLYHLPAGARIDDALTAAGGPRRGVDLSTLNLAAVVVDGQQILVGAAGAPAAGGGVPAPVEAPATTSSSIAPVSLNTASLEQLETLPRIGPVTAQKILDYRAAHGSFTSVDQLKDVSGIGDVTFAGLAPLVTL